MTYYCIVCGNHVSPYKGKSTSPSKLRSDMRFCSRACFNQRDSATEPTESRFWKRVNKHGPHHPECGQCWLWTGWLNDKGYGRMSVNRVEVPVHRYSLELHFGPFPKEWFTLHRCDVPACVNPSHLFTGTVYDNNADMVTKHRQARGEMKSSIAIFTTEQIIAIRARYVPRCQVNGGVAIAREFGCNPKTINDIVRRKNWKHIQ